MPLPNKGMKVVADSSLQLGFGGGPAALPLGVAPGVRRSWALASKLNRVSLIVCDSKLPARAISPFVRCRRSLRVRNG